MRSRLLLGALTVTVVCLPHFCFGQESVGKDSNRGNHKLLLITVQYYIVLQSTTNL